MTTLNSLLPKGTSSVQIKRAQIKNKVQRIKTSSEDLYLIIILMFSAPLHPKLYIKWTFDTSQDALKAQSVHDKAAQSPWLTAVPNIIAILSAYQSAIYDWLNLIATAENGTRQDKIKLEIFSADFRSITSARIVEIAQRVADTNIENALQVATSCDMDLKGKGGRTPQEWSVTRESAGSYKLSAAIGDYSSKHYVVQWQRTMEPLNPESWYWIKNHIIPTPNSATYVNDMTLTDLYYFRYRIITTNEVTDWSYIISIVIS